MKDKKRERKRRSSVEFDRAKKALHPVINKVSRVLVWCLTKNSALIVINQRLIVTKFLEKKTFTRDRDALPPSNLTLLRIREKNVLLLRFHDTFVIWPASFAPRFFLKTKSLSISLFLSVSPLLPCNSRRAFLLQAFSAVPFRCWSRPSGVLTVRARQDTLPIRCTESLCVCVCTREREEEWERAYRSLPRKIQREPAEIFSASITDACKHVLCMIITPFPVASEYLTGSSNALMLSFSLSFSSDILSTIVSSFHRVRTKKSGLNVM